MNFNGLRIEAEPVIRDAVCTKCGSSCEVVGNGFLEEIFFCSNCEAVLQLKLVKLPDKQIDEEFLIQCRKRVKQRIK